MPFSLLLSWAISFGLANIHYRETRYYQGELTTFYHVLTLSWILGGAVNFGLLIFYFLQVQSWWWPIFVFLAGSALAAFLSLIMLLIMGILFGEISGAFYSILIPFLGWPTAAIWSFIIIKGL